MWSSDKFVQNFVTRDGIIMGERDMCSRINDSVSFNYGMNISLKIKQSHKRKLI